MFEVDRSLDFDAPVARVWDVFLDLDNWAEWSESKSFFSGSTRMRFAPAEGSLRGPGFKIVADNRRGKTHTLIVQEWDKPNLVKFDTFDSGDTPGFKMSMSWRFSAKSAIATHLDYHLEFEFDMVPAILGGFVQSRAEKKIDEIFARSRKFL